MNTNTTTNTTTNEIKYKVPTQENISQIQFLKLHGSISKTQCIEQIVFPSINDIKEYDDGEKTFIELLKDNIIYYKAKKKYIDNIHKQTNIKTIYFKEDTPNVINSLEYENTGQTLYSFKTDINKYFKESKMDKMNFIEGEALKPFVQLLCVLPQQSNYLVPSKLKNIMTNLTFSLFL